MADEGWLIKALPGPSAIVCVSPSSTGGRAFFVGRMDSGISPSAPRRMTVGGGGGLGGKSDYFISEIPTIKESSALCISF